MSHDPLCPVTDCRPTADECYCDNGPHFCQCKTIAKVRADEAPKAVTRWIEQGAASDNWMKVWQVRDYAEELEAKVRADTLDDFLNRVLPETFNEQWRLGYEQGKRDSLEGAS